MGWQRQRRGGWDAVKALALGGGLALLGAWFWSWSVGQECLDRVKVGMPAERARSILLDRGFRSRWLGCHEGQTRVAYRRSCLDPAILVEVDNWTGLVVAKERQPLGEWLLDFVTDPRRWRPTQDQPSGAE